jgi:predicted dehydrogenase
MPIKVAVIGGGKFGYNHLLAFSQLQRDGICELAALADPNEQLLEQRRGEFGVRTYTSHQQMLQDEPLDAVSIATPDHLHRQIALDAAAAGRHLLVEKPLDTTTEGCRQIIAATRAQNLLLQVDFHKRYDPDHIALRRRIQSGDLGEILYGHVWMEDRIEVPSRWFPHWAPHSSPAWFLGIHFYDLVRWMIGSEAVRVTASAQKRKLISMGVDTFDAIQARVDFASGASISFDTAWILPDSFEAVVCQGVRLVGTEGMYIVNSQDRGSRSCLASEGMRTHNNNFLRRQVDRCGRETWTGYGIESIADFIHNLTALKQGATLESLGGRYPAGEDAQAATAIAAAVHQSIREGSTVEVQTDEPASGA